MPNITITPDLISHGCVTVTRAGKVTIRGMVVMSHLIDLFGELIDNPTFRPHIVYADGWLEFYVTIDGNTFFVAGFKTHPDMFLEIMEPMINAAGLTYSESIPPQ